MAVTEHLDKHTDDAPRGLCAKIKRLAAKIRAVIQNDAYYLNLLNQATAIKAAAAMWGVPLVAKSRRLLAQLHDVASAAHPTERAASRSTPAD